ncbi:MAG TPA: isocitrate/isopropylmalate family dehydrogenase [Trebonia sp.]
MSYRVGVAAASDAGERLAADLAGVVGDLGVRLDLVPVRIDRLTYGKDSAAGMAVLRGTRAVFRPDLAAKRAAPGLSWVFVLRKELRLSVNERTFRGIGARRGTVTTVVRENSEGSYLGEGGTLHAGTDEEVATQGSVNTYAAVRRCVRHAFALAREAGSDLMLAHKPGVLQFAGPLWQRVLESTGRDEFPGVGCETVAIDVACAQVVADPARYRVIVTDNMFGDIISDVAGAAVGASWYSASAEVNVHGDGPSLFEPMHASGIAVAAPLAEHAAFLGGASAVAALLTTLGEIGLGRALTEAVLTTAEGATPVPCRQDLAAQLAAAARAALREVPA